MEKGALNAEAENDVADSTPEPHTISHRRKIGAFYTPLNVTTILCKWGVRTKDDTVLEPCFGGCTFLEALLARLKALGQTRAEKQLFGSDIDPLAFQYLETLGAIAKQKENFILSDFLSLHQKDQHEGKVDLVIGNPPYIRHSKFDAAQKEAIHLWTEKYSLQIDGRASLWAYFVLHALNFLKEGGRIAWVLPVSFLTSAYAKQVRDILSKNFTRIAAITLAERLFISEGTEEITIILLAEGFKRGKSEADIAVNCFDTVKELEAFIETWHTAQSVSSSQPNQGNGMVPALAVSSFSSLQNNAQIKRLGEIASVKIGLVTGDSNYFIKSREAWKQLGISTKYLRYILPKSKWINGIELNDDDANVHTTTNVPCLALNCPTVPRAISIRNYLHSYSKKRLSENATFRRREVWHYFFDKKIPDAFLVFLTHLGPRMVLNSTAANCTNSIYRIFFKKKLSLEEKMLCAITLHTTYSQLSAELIGQGRGSGALKLEPSHANQLSLYMPLSRSPQKIRIAFSNLDALLRNGKTEDARKFSDMFIYGDIPEFLCALPILENGLSTGRARRMRSSTPPI